MIPQLYTDKLFEKARKWQKLQTTGYLSSSPPSSPLFRLLLSLFLYSPPPLLSLSSLSHFSPPYPSPSPPHPNPILLTRPHILTSGSGALVASSWVRVLESCRRDKHAVMRHDAVMRHNAVMKHNAVMRQNVCWAHGMRNPQWGYMCSANSAFSTTCESA